MTHDPAALTQAPHYPFTVLPFTPHDQIDPIIQAWEEAFREPPNGPRWGSELRSQLERHSTIPHFHAYFARHNVSGDVLGVIYGYSNLPGQWWYDQVARALGERKSAEWLVNSYCLSELGVVPQARRHGVALALVNALVTNQPFSHVLLSTRSDNTKGLAFYKATNWQIVCRRMSFGWNYPPYDILMQNTDARNHTPAENVK